MEAGREDQVRTVPLSTLDPQAAEPVHTAAEAKVQQAAARTEAVADQQAAALPPGEARTSSF